MVTDAVQNFYNCYPYPFADIKNSNNIKGANLFKLLEYESRTRGFVGKTFLDAGCGSGHRTLDIAEAFPKASFYGFDLSETSIELAKRQAAKNSVTNVEFEHGDIHKYKTDRLFDVIIAHGVISHLSEPQDGIKNLTRYLKDDGLFVAWIFHAYGEFEKMLQRDLLCTLLSHEEHNAKTGVSLMRELGLSISKSRYGNSYGDELTEQDKLSKDADAFLNPQVVPFTFKEAMDLFRNSNLEWVSVEQINYRESGYFISLQEDSTTPFWMLDVRDLLNARTAFEYYQSLSAIDKLHIIELIARPTGFTIFAGMHNSMALGSKRIKENCISLNNL